MSGRGRPPIKLRSEMIEKREAAVQRPRESYSKIKNSWYTQSQSRDELDVFKKKGSMVELVK